MRLKEYLHILLSYARSHKQEKERLNIHARELAFLVPHAKKNIRRYLGLFFVALLSSGLNLLEPAITGQIIDRAFISKFNRNLLFCCAD